MGAMSGSNEDPHVLTAEQEEPACADDQTDSKEKRKQIEVESAPVVSKKARKAQTSKTKSIVALANRQPPQLDAITCTTSDSQAFILNFHESLEGHLLDWAVELLETNMRPMYEDGWGWDSNVKFKEMTSPKARFVVASLPAAEKGPPVPVGFVQYRFLADARRPVLYVYEIQVSASAQGLGVGRQMMKAAEIIGNEAGMSCILLTVFKHNPEALKFYKKVGYALDQKAGSNGECFQELCKVL